MPGGGGEGQADMGAENEISKEGCLRSVRFRQIEGPRSCLHDVSMCQAGQFQPVSVS